MDHQFMLTRVVGHHHHTALRLCPTNPRCVRASVLAPLAHRLTLVRVAQQRGNNRFWHRQCGTLTLALLALSLRIALNACCQPELGGWLRDGQGEEEFLRG